MATQTITVRAERFVRIMRLSQSIIEQLQRCCGHVLQIPADCEYLALDIESKTGIHIGATTLKRLLGFAADARSPHESTLNLIAQYLGFANWRELAKTDTEGNSGFDMTNEEIRSANLKIGSQVEIKYLPDRRIVLDYLGDNHYCVSLSENSKLSVGDKLEIYNFVLRHPLLALNVWRNNQPLGQFTAGRISGLSSIEIL